MTDTPIRHEAEVRLTGLLGKRAELVAAQLDAETPYSVAHVLQDVVLHPDRRRECDDYSGDLSGRWLEAAARAAELGLSVDPAKQDATLRGLLGVQNGDGSFGRDRGWGDTDHGVIWGNGRLLMGLLAQRERVREDHPLHVDLERAIDALTEHLVTVTPIWLRWFDAPENRYGKFALDLFSILQPLATIARSAPNERRVQAVEALARAVPVESEHPYHTHGYLLALRGALLWHTAQADGAAIEVIYRAYQRVERTALTAQGTTKETLAFAGDVNTEGCGVADWLMLTLELHDVLGHEHLLTEANHVASNGLPHVQAPSGHFGCETITADPGLLTSDYPPEAWWCCTFHGLLAILEFARRSVVLRDGEVHVQFLHASSTKLTTGDGLITVELSADFPWTSEVRIDRRGGVGDLVVHAPSEYRLVGTDSSPDRSGPALRYGAETTSLELPLDPVVWVAAGPNRYRAAVASTTDAVDPLLGKRVAVFRGALLLAADAGANSAADVVRARRVLLHERHGSFAPLSTGEGARVAVRGHLIESELELRPLAASFGRDNDLVRVEFDEVAVVHENGTPRVSVSPQWD